MEKRYYFQSDLDPDSVKECFEITFYKFVLLRTAIPLFLDHNLLCCTVNNEFNGNLTKCQTDVCFNYNECFSHLQVTLA